MLTIDKLNAYKPNVEILSKYIKDKKMLEFPLHALKVEGTIKNTHPAYINSLLRACFEADHYALECEYENIKKEDEHINTIMLLDNIRLVPLRYGITDDIIDGLVMRIDVTNKNEDDFYVKTGDIRFNKKINPIFLPNIPLIALGKGKRLVVENIRIVKGNNFDHVRFSPITTTYSASSKTSVREMDNGNKLRDFTFKFHINSILDTDDDKSIAYEIINVGRLSLIERLNSILTAIKTKDVEYVDIDNETLTINYPENNTISRIIFIGMNLELKDLKFISHTTEINENMIIVIKYPDVQINTIKVFDKLIKYFTELY